MAAGIYSAKIEHNEKTIERLYRARYHAYENARMYMRMLIGLVLIFAAAFMTLATILRGLMLLLGAWLLVSADFPAAVQADRALENRKAKLPLMKYEFFPDNMTVSGEGKMSIPYRKFDKLAYDGEYLYLFENASSICMLECGSIKPEGSAELMKFLAEKTGKQWQQEKSILSLNFYDIRRIITERRNKKP